MTDQAKTDSLDCPGTAADAVAEMPGEMRTAEIQSEATSQYLVNKVKAAIPLTASAMKTFYNEHADDYDTLCVSIALVPPADVTAFAQSQAAGLSVAELAKKYSQDPSAAKGGAYGCFAPASTSYSGVRAAVGTERLDVFPTTPEYTDYNGTEYALYVAVTKRTLTPYAQAAQAVLSDLQTLNAAAASSERITCWKTPPCTSIPPSGVGARPRRDPQSSRNHGTAEERRVRCVAAGRRGDYVV